MRAHTSIKSFEETEHPSLLEEILYGEGSLTLKLDELFGTVTVDRCRTTFVPLGEEAAATLDADAGEEAMEREALLKAGDAALVFAKTTIPTRALSKELSGELKEGTTPLGRILHSKGITLHRAGLEVTAVKNKEAAKELGLDPATTHYERSYRLDGRRGGIVEIKAAIREFISPRAARAGSGSSVLEGPLAEPLSARTG